MHLLCGGKAERAMIVWGRMVALFQPDWGSAAKDCGTPSSFGQAIRTFTGFVVALSLSCVYGRGGARGDPFPLAPDTGRLEEEEVVRALRCLACTL